MSDPDSAQRRRPPTIDLTAQEVATERPADAQASAAASAAAADTRWNRRGERIPVWSPTSTGRHLTSSPGLSEPP